MRRDEGWPSRGITIGFNRETGGGWAEECLAHESQLRELPDTVSDNDALLLDPACAALAALLRTQQSHHERTLVIGGGTIGQIVARLHSALELPGSCELLVRYDHQAGVAKGATLARNGSDFESWAASRNITSRRVQAYGLVHSGVFDRVIDCAGTRESLSWAMAAVKPRGDLVLVTAAALLTKWDPTSIWYRELTVHGINQYGPVPWNGAVSHPYDVLIPLLAIGRLRLGDLVTHEFTLENYVAAFDACVQRANSGAIKVSFRPGTIS
jgi:threonine dehydrogenase-like Zn-dependent dehydrogenase